MDIRTTFSVTLPHHLIEALHITETTPFIVTFENETVTIEPILQETEDDISDREFDCTPSYIDGYADGILEGYTNGYRQGFDDAAAGHAFNDHYRNTIGNGYHMCIDAPCADDADED